MRVQFRPSSSAAAAVLVLLHSGAHTSAQSTPHVEDLFRAYERGEYNRAVEALTTIPDHVALGKQIQKIGPVWIKSSREKESDRRMIVATVALEVARAGAPDEWETSRRLIEWACGLLRGSGEPHRGERAWHIAAIAVIQGAYDGRFLLEHLRHAEPRFPDEPRFALARAVDAERETWPGARLPTRESESEARARAERAYARGVAPMHQDMRAVRVWNLIPIFQGLTKNPHIAAETWLRLGHVHYRVGGTDLAIQEFRRAEAESSDTFVTFLAAYFGGRALEALGDRAGATAAYRRALLAVPGAQSALSSLAALLFAGGDREEAVKLIEDFLAAPRSIDPWRLYQSGYYRSLPVLMNQLRAELR